MSEKPVKVVLDGQTVHECNSITEAEEWMVDDPSTDKDRVAAGDYQIECDESAVKQFEAGGRGTDSEVPEVEAVNTVAVLRETLANLVEAIATGGKEEGADALDAARDVLEAVPPSEAHPFLTTFDEIVSQGRLNLIEFVDSGDTSEMVSMDTIVSEMQEPTTNARERLARPLRAEDALRLLRNRARNVTHGLGVAPLYFAVPGMKSLLKELDEAVMVPSLSDYGDEDLSLMMPHAVTYDEWKHGSRTVSRAHVEKTAAQRGSEE